MNSPECITERCIAEVIRDAAKAVGYDHHLVRMLVSLQLDRGMAIIHSGGDVVKRYALSILPNEAGFRFIGITHDGDEIPCEVRVGPMDMHGVYRISDGAPVWFQLASWEYSKEKA